MIKYSEIDIVEVLNIGENGENGLPFLTFTYKNDAYTEPNWYFTNLEKLGEYLENNVGYPKKGIY